MTIHECNKLSNLNPNKNVNDDILRRIFCGVGFFGNIHVFGWKTDFVMKTRTFPEKIINHKIISFHESYGQFEYF